MIDLIFEGLEKTDIDKFDPIVNQIDGTKPSDGFWTSPMMKNGLSAWRAFCDDDNATRGYSTSHWHIILNKECRILCIETRTTG